jgi:hypothetical protein
MLNWPNLKVALTVSCLALQLNLVSGQDKGADQPNIISAKPITTTGLGNFTPDKKKRWIRIDEVLVETFNITLTPIEEQLARAESGEIKALLKRDTTALKNTWLRDFTLDEPHNKVHHDQNPLPHYLSLHRRIEKILIAGNHAYVSGVEYAVQIQEDSTVNTQVARKYTHMWIKAPSGWKLATKN